MKLRDTLQEASGNSSKKALDAIKKAYSNSAYYSVKPKKSKNGLDISITMRMDGELDTITFFVNENENSVEMYDPMGGAIQDYMDTSGEINIATFIKFMTSPSTIKWWSKDAPEELGLEKL